MKYHSTPVSTFFTRLVIAATLSAALFSAASVAQSALPFNPAIAVQTIIPLILGDCDPRNKEIREGDVLVQSQADLNALANVAIINGHLTIRSNTNLSFGPLDNLVKVDGALDFMDSPLQTSFSGFNCLKFIDDFLIYNNPLLRTVNGFGKLETIFGNLDIGDNTALTTLPNFSSLRNMSGEIQFYRLPNLTRLPDFPALQTLGNGADVNINRVTSITDISGFNNLEGVGNVLRIRRNNQLQKITGFAKLTAANVLGGSEVDNNIALDCQQPTPTFAPVGVSSGNLVDC